MAHETSSRCDGNIDEIQGPPWARGPGLNLLVLRQCRPTKDRDPKDYSQRASAGEQSTMPSALEVRDRQSSALWPSSHKRARCSCRGAEREGEGQGRGQEGHGGEDGPASHANQSKGRLSYKHRVHAFCTVDPEQRPVLHLCWVLSAWQSPAKKSPSSSSRARRSSSGSASVPAPPPPPPPPPEPEPMDVEEVDDDDLMVDVEPPKATSPPRGKRSRNKAMADSSPKVSRCL